MAIVGIFFGSDTGNTENIAKMIQKQLGKDVADVHDIDKSSKEDLAGYDILLLGIPTWYYGEAQCDWDDFFPSLEEVDFNGKLVALFGRLHDGARSQPPGMPAGVVASAVRFEAGREPARSEVFIAGTEQTLVRASAQVGGTGPQGEPRRDPWRYGIVSPRDGSVFAIDPDMPPAAQRIGFEGEAGVWVLDGKRLGAASRWDWAPWPGKHELALLGPDGAAIQRVRFEVRGAGLKEPPRAELRSGADKLSGKKYAPAPRR